MGKNKKKRNKVYAGVDAAMTRPNITRIEAVNRSKVGQWWLDNKKVAKPIIRIALIVLAATIIIIGIVSLFTN
jgi:hypothetical protein